MKARINERIRVPEVRVIDEQGQQVGILPTAKALELAREKGLDLIEVSPKAQPPVAKLLSYDKYRYQQEKAVAQQRKRQKKVEIKGIRLSVRIGRHDREFKARQAEKFLSRGNKVKIDMLLRGRERANVAFAFEVMKKFFGTLTAEFVTEQEPKKTGHMISAVIAPK